MKFSACIATVTIILLLSTLAAFADVAAILEFRYRGTELPAENRQSLERTLRQELRPAHPVRMVVTITDRVIATR
ncbi:MAG TPA: hypothetical protein VN605_07065 [Thermoanaerobaculia bacterium]|nr:hypothetical protein [Thermoanaerobaculia bacterium]